MGPPQDTHGDARDSFPMTGDVTYDSHLVKVPSPRALLYKCLFA